MCMDKYKPKTGGLTFQNDCSKCVEMKPKENLLFCCTLRRN